MLFKQLLILLVLFFEMNTNMLAQSSTDSLKKHVVKLSELPYPRNHQHPEMLQEAAAYIQAKFALYSNYVFLQPYRVGDQTFKNVIASFGPDSGARVIVGASYDTFEDSPGADGNASGIAALIEMTRLLSKVNKYLNFRVDVVAYSLHEPPFFNTIHMGSYHHAKSLMDNHVSVLGMINLKSIGYYTDKPYSQKFPFFGMRWLYGHRGNFVCIVQKIGNGTWASRMRGLMRQYIVGMKAYNVKPLVYFKEISNGDHKNYWEMGYPAIMITDGMQFRNQYYHFDSDTYETLDYFRMKKVVDMTYQAILHYKQ